MKRKTAILFTELPTAYHDLVAYFPPRPIHDARAEADTENVVLAMVGHDLNADEQDYLDILSDQLLKYESRFRRPAKQSTGHRARQKH